MSDEKYIPMKPAVADSLTESESAAIHADATKTPAPSNAPIAPGVYALLVATVCTCGHLMLAGGPHPVMSALGGLDIRIPCQACGKVHPCSPGDSSPRVGATPARQEPSRIVVPQLRATRG